jgi:endonuclease-3
MAAPSRSTLIAQTHKVLKRHYQPIAPDNSRSILEHVIYGLLLENAPYAAADGVMASLRETYFDWNEVRVAAVSDLTEQLKRLPSPAVTATSLRDVLQAVFDATFSFDLEALRKENLGKAMERLQRFRGSRPFMVSYAVQAGLGGHAIPLDRGAMEVFALLGVIARAERDSGAVPGLERTIPKNKGIDFGSLLHQLSADYVANPYAPSVHKVLLEISPAVKDRLPKRGKKYEDSDKGAKPALAQPTKGASTRSRQPKKPESKKPAAAAGARRKPR